MRGAGGGRVLRVIVYVSSGRRHTRSKRDWSSDVCSSDLTMLRVQNVDLYYGAAQAVRSVSLSASQGKVTCLLGRNGVGKTSLLRAICGLQPITSGSIRSEERRVGKEGRCPRGYRWGRRWH